MCLEHASVYELSMSQVCMKQAAKFYMCFSGAKSILNIS